MASANDSALTVVTWNVNSVRSRLERLLALLEREQPDVVCLQELKCLEESFPAAEIRAKGYHAAVSGQKTYNGVAILSRTEPTDIARGFEDGDPDPAARWIAATVDGVRVVSAYIPNGQAVGTEKYQYKLNWLARMKGYLERKHRASDKLIVAGDFNVAPEDRDVHDPDLWRGKILFSEPERAALKSACSLPLYDTFRRHHDDPGHYSWWDYRQLAFPKNLGLRIDFIFATTPLWESCTAAKILRDERKGALPSDHAPVSATFQR